MNKSAQWNRTLVRNNAQKVYKTLKKENAQIGVQIDVLFQEFHKEMKVQLKLEPKDRNADRLKNITEKIKELRKNHTFKREFPSFALFRKYCKKENIVPQDLL